MSTTPPRSSSALLHDALKGALGASTKLVVTDNRSTVLSHVRKAGQSTVRLHHMFLNADERIRADLVAYLTTKDTGAGKRLDGFIAAHNHLLRRATPAAVRENASQGRVFDLAPHFAALNHTYFSSGIQADLMWGRAGTFRGKRRRSIKLGSYDHRARCITMHPALDQDFVPALVVDRVLHHEMLHQLHPITRDASGRRVVHSKAFRRDEALFAGAHEADRWLAANMAKLLAYKGPREATSSSKRAPSQGAPRSPTRTKAPHPPEVWP